MKDHEQAFVSQSFDYKEDHGFDQRQSRRIERIACATNCRGAN